WIICSTDLGDATPFEDFVVDGDEIYLGDDDLNWSWDLTPGPCGEVLGSVPFTMNGEATTHLEGPSLDQVTINWQLSGTYELTLIVETSDGPLSCTFQIQVLAPGLRVELCWDTTGVSDLDAHLGKLGTTNAWFSTTSSTADCHYSNCKVTGNDVEWGYPDVDGYPNPRLDIDNISSPGVPENINLDNPGEGDQFRVMVHYYGSSDDPDPECHPVVNIYCGGVRLATYGVAPELEEFDYGCGQFWTCNGDAWKVVDVTTHLDLLGDTTCDLDPVVDDFGDYWLEQLPLDWP
ncbi:MAG: hypothetical protein JRF63_09045, partial [Deltaproteobacteria bacterium]|nr:hypothetical protein [Deltaproteobacteria bacterium]